MCDRIWENRPPCTSFRNRDSAINDVIEVWSRSGENLEAIAPIVFEIVGFRRSGHILLFSLSS